MSPWHADHGGNAMLVSISDGHVSCRHMAVRREDRGERATPSGRFVTGRRGHHENWCSSRRPEIAQYERPREN